MARQEELVNGLNNAEPEGRMDDGVHDADRSASSQWLVSGSDTSMEKDSDGLMVELPDDLLRLATATAARQSETLEEFVTKAIQEHLAERRATWIV